MSTLTIIIGIVAPVITFLIGRYFRMQELFRLMQERDDYKNRLSERINSDYYYASTLEKRNREYWQENHLLTTQNNALLGQISELATVQIVPNITPHHAADKEYIGIYPNNGLEPAHLTREEYQKGVDRLKDNPEDKILTKPVK
jgi:hypothetical protein